MSVADTPSFGTNIRAYRLGWGYAKAHGCFIRMSDADGENSRIELCPISDVPVNKTPGHSHRCWWDSPSILTMIPWLRMVRRIKRYVCVIVDTHGAIIRTENS